MPVKPFRLRCRYCNQPVDWPPQQPRCPRPSCRGPLQPKRNIVFDAQLIELAAPGMWRYRHLLPPVPDNPISLGEGWTPLLRLEPGSDRLIYVKNETLNPTGSFKDRGAAFLINTIQGEDKIVIDDSSGNAGAALAAYAARAGRPARIFVPATAPEAKKTQIERYGAKLIPVAGDRDAVARAADAFAQQPNVFYASHVWHPGYALAMQTIAWETWEQIGRRAPEWVILPAGNGSLLRGVRWGFRALQKAKYIKTLPRLVAVQAENCAPLAAFMAGEYRPGRFQARPTRADGVAAPNPPLIEAMAAAVRKTRGKVVTIPEDAIRQAQTDLARKGFYVEPTAALPYAALPRLASQFNPNDAIVLILTGHGFKAQ
ncbi:MAG TPA: pyridoxal-phosphate dependent enzyme [Anaerolineae bacterium]|nr:pyridoxal-phosphate dependent enzyme [Anaerolineae bacterium]